MSGSAPAAPPTSAARGSATLGLAFLVVGGGNYVFTVALAYLLDRDAYGVVTVVQSFLLFAAWFTSAGFPWVAARRLSAAGSRADQAATMRGALLGNLVVASLLAMVLVALLLAGVFHLGPQTGAPLMLAALACSLAGLNAAFKGGLQGLFRFRMAAAVNVIEIVVKVGLGIGLAAAGLGATGAALGIVAGLLVANVVSLVSLRELPLRTGRGLGGRGLLRETLPIFAGTAGMALLTSIDLFAVKILTTGPLSNDATALYGAAVTLARIPYFFASALTTAVFPHIARTRADRAASGLYVRKGVLFVIALLAPISLALVAVPGDVLAALYPGDYAAAADALRLAAAGTTLLALSAFLVGALQAVGRDRIPAVVIGASVAVEVIGLAIGIPIGERHGETGGLVAAALSYDVATVIAALSHYIASWRVFGWRPRPRGAIAFIACAGAFVGVLRALPHHGRPMLVLAGLAALGVYAALATTLGLLSAGDVRTLRSGLPGLAPPEGPDRLEIDDGRLEVVCHGGPDALEAASPAWHRLLADGEGTPPFLRPEWIRPWMATYGHGRLLRLVEVRDRGRPIALAFFTITTVRVLGLRRLELVGGSPGDWSIWLRNPHSFGAAYANDILVAPGAEAEAVTGLTAWLRAADREWDELRWTLVPENGPLWASLERLLDGRRMQRTELVRHTVATADGWEAYYATCSKRRRRHLRYEPANLERAAGAALEVEWLRGPEAVAAMEEFIALHIRRWTRAGKPGLVSGEAALYRRIASGGGGGVVVLRLRAGAQLLAMQWGFDDGLRYLPYNFAFNPDFERYSPSNVLIQLAIERCCRDGHREVDLAGLGSGANWTESARRYAIVTSTRDGRIPRLRSALWGMTCRGVGGAQTGRVGRALRAAVAAAGAAARAGRTSRPAATSPDVPSGTADSAPV